MFWKCSGHAQKSVSQVILDPVKLTINLSHNTLHYIILFKLKEFFTTFYNLTITPKRVKALMCSVAEKQQQTEM